MGSLMCRSERCEAESWKPHELRVVTWAEGRGVDYGGKVRSRRLTLCSRSMGSRRIRARGLASAHLSAGIRKVLRLARWAL